MVDLSRCYLHDLGEAEAAKLADLRSRVPAAIERAREESVEARAKEKLDIWGVNITVPSDSSDIVLLKFLRAEELDVDKAEERVTQTLIFRADCRIDELARAELPAQFIGHDTIGGRDTVGRPVMISRFGGMDLQQVMGNIEMFVRYRAKMMEEAISQLTFEKGAPEDLCQVHDYAGVPLIFHTSEVKGAVSAVSKVFGDHYPEFKGVSIFLNFPAAFTKLFKAFSVFIPERTRKKFLILGEADHDRLFEHIRPEYVLEELGGMLRSPPGPISGACELVTVKARGTEERTMLEVQPGAKVCWELRVCSAEVAYEVVFVPSDGGEEVVIQRNLAKEYLQASDGVASAIYESAVAGVLRCRFKNEHAWFKTRLGICRAGLIK